MVIVFINKINKNPGWMAELVDATHSKCVDFNHEGSSPSLLTYNMIYCMLFIKQK